MEALIIKLITMSIQATIAIAVVVLARAIFGLLKIPKKYAYLLWVIPFVRLCIPFAVESQFSIMPDSFSFAQAEMVDEHSNDTNGNGYSNDYEREYYQDANASDDVQYSDEYYEEYNYILESNGLGSGDGYDVDSDEVGNSSEDVVINSEGNSVGDSIDAVNSSGIGTAQGDNSQLNQNNKIDQSTGYPSWTRPACIVWYIGVAIFIIYSYIAYLKLRKTLESKVLLQDNVYMSDYIDTGFVIGAFKPYICIPSDLDKDKQEYVIAHESYHIKRRDYIAKTIYFIITVVHWFNPFVWLAYFLMERDMEMSCDEAVLYELGLDNRKNYANTLLHMATDRRNPISMPIAFGEGSTKGRIKNIMKSKKPVVVLVVVAVAVILALCGLLLTNPSDKSNNGDKNDIATTTDANVATDSDGEINTDTDAGSENVSSSTDADVSSDNADVSLRSGKYIFVPDGETIEQASTYAPYIIVNTNSRDITVVSTSWTSVMEYGKYYLKDNELSCWVGGDMNYYFNIEEDKLIYKANSFDIKYLKENDDYVYRVPVGGELVFVPDSEFNMAGVWDGYSNQIFDKEYADAIEVEIIPPDIADTEGIGADAPKLDFADMKFVIFHDYRGLYVYDRAAGGIRGAVNLEVIGMNYTQGDKTCFVSVGNNGYRVYFKTMSSNVAYVYDVQYNQLFQVDKAYVEAQESFTSTLVTDELFGDDFTTWQSYNCVEIYEAGTTYYGYLTSASGLWEDMSFVERTKDTDAFRRFSLVREYKDMIVGEERASRLEDVRLSRNLMIDDSQTADTPDYSLYDEIIEKHSLARHEAWDRSAMEQNGLAPSELGIRYDGYGYQDITGDGVNELLVGFTVDNTSFILAVYTIRDGKVEILLSGHERSIFSLCENNVIKHVWSNNASNSGREFFYIDGTGGISYLEGVVCDGNYSGKHPWYYTTEYGKYYSYECEPVTEEYALDILGGYNIINVHYTDFKPTEASVSETIPYFSPEEDEAKNAFGTMMEDWKSNPEVTEVMSGYDDGRCGYYDIDSDGVVELIISNEKCLGIFKYEDGVIKRIYCGTYSVLLEDGTVQYYRPGGAPENKIYKFYRYNGTEYVEVDSFEWYNNDEGGNQYASQDDIYYYNGELTTYDEWYELLAPYMVVNYARKENMFIIYNN